MDIPCSFEFVVIHGELEVCLISVSKRQQKQPKRVKKKGGEGGEEKVKPGKKYKGGR